MKPFPANTNTMSLKRSVDSSAVRVRTAWYLVVAKVNGVVEVHIGYRYYDQSISLYMVPIPGSTMKKPWGPVKGCQFKPNFKNGKGVEADYFFIENEKQGKRMFKAQMMNPLLFGINDFSKQCAGLRVSNRGETLGVYMNFLNTAKGFLHHQPEVHNEWGLKLGKEAEQIEDIEKKDGTMEEYKVFVENAVSCAMNVEKRPDILKEISTRSVTQTDEAGVVKRSKQQVIEGGKQEEIDDEFGVEKAFINGYLGRAMVSIDRLSVSKEVFTTMNQYKVTGLAKSTKERCDLSNLVMTVVPNDMKNFDENALEENEYGRHRFEALKKLDRRCP